MYICKHIRFSLHRRKSEIKRFEQPQQDKLSPVLSPIKNGLSRTQKKLSRGLMLEPWRPSQFKKTLHGPSDQLSYRYKNPIYII